VPGITTGRPEATQVGCSGCLRFEPPEVPEGRDPGNVVLVSDARRKAVNRGLPYYFTCNMAEIVLFSVGLRPGELDREERRYELAPVSHSSELLAYMDTVESDWRSAGDRTEALP
jgi:hypothetical protein